MSGQRTTPGGLSGEQPSRKPVGQSLFPAPDPLGDLTAEEVVMLGHVLRMVPDNACLTGESASRLSGKRLAFFHEIPAFKTLWEKVAAAISQRDDVAPFRRRK